MAGKRKFFDLRDWVLAHIAQGRADQCWEWTSAIGSHGYGSGSFASNHVTSHTSAYRAFVGEIPNGMHVLHRCDNRSCCNPDHLFLGTHVDNMDDMVGKDRQAFGVRKIKSAKLTELQVLQIRAAKAVQAEIATEYGVNQSVVSRIKSRKAWRLTSEHSL